MSEIRTADEAAIRAVLDDSYRAWAAGDAAAMVAAYAEDASAIMPGSFRGSREVIRESMAGAFAGPLKDTSIRSRELSVRFRGPTPLSSSARRGSSSPVRPRCPRHAR